MDLGEEKKCPLCFEDFVSFGGREWCDDCRKENDKLMLEVSS